mgnify:FL=1|tara:strand:- start:3227 stop:3472 length:246 start_codon:yes stop_codon:yes gene_type:complete
MKSKNVQTDGRIIIDDETYELGTCVWEMNGVLFKPVSVKNEKNFCECGTSTIHLVCEDRKTIIVCKSCDELRMYDKRSNRK